MDNFEKAYQELIDELFAFGVLKSSEITRAFRKIKRMDFMLPGEERNALDDAAFLIGQGQTISQPTTVAFMLELLQPKKGDRILDVGSGSGWTTALLGEIVGASGKVFGIERLSDICGFGTKNINKYGFMDSGIASNVCADGYAGLPQYAPFDKILVSAAAKKVPENLLKQLKAGGRMVIPIDQGAKGQSIFLVEKMGENEYKEIQFPGFVFVPLVHD